LSQPLNIKVLGAGCSGNCSLLERNVLAVLDELSLKYDLERVNDLTSMVKYGCLEAPGLVINEKLVSQGIVLTREQIRELLTNHDSSVRDSE
jgi:hypothetical protein